MDVNLVLAGLLFDLAFLAGESQRAWGYKRAAKAVLRLDQHITPLVDANTFRSIPGIGPTTDRIAREVVHDGTSAFVERSIDESGKAEKVLALRALRQHYLSRAAVKDLLRRPGEPAVKGYRGDFQMHSVWSDGAEPLESIVEACLSRGHTCAGITDHSYGLPIAGGMSMDDAARQRQAIDEVNATCGRQFRLLQGIEANIGVDGQLDLTEDEAATFDIVLAAPHSRLRKSDDQTERMLAAIAHPAVRVLAHPRGRITGTRAGVVADCDAVFASAAQRGVAIEIDGDPARQDLDYVMASRALEAGCLFALDSDAHTTTQLAYAETALAHARLAGIPPDRIVNGWPLDRLLAWL